MKRKIRIIVVDNSKAEKCDGHCGTDWSSVEAITLANQRIKERFGNKIQLEYFDLSKSITNGYALRVTQRVKDKKLSLPALLINGESRISGQFDIRLLLDAIEAELEINHG